MDNDIHWRNWRVLNEISLSTHGHFGATADINHVFVLPDCHSFKTLQAAACEAATSSTFHNKVRLWRSEKPPKQLYKET